MQTPIQQLQDLLGTGTDDIFSWVEAHGYITAMVCHNWPTGQYTPIQEPTPAALTESLDLLFERINAQLGADEEFTLPCLLDPYQEEEGIDLVSWCAGFMTALIFHAPGDSNWPENVAEEQVQLTMPMLLISGLYDEGEQELDNLWEDEKIMLQMAHSIPSLVIDLFLLFHASEENK